MGHQRISSEFQGILGKGAYGLVYRATDSQGNKIAAKRIDTHDKYKLTEITADLGKLKELDHPNIGKVHDIHQEENVIWVFMDLCEHGDLN